MPHPETDESEFDAEFEDVDDLTAALAGEFGEDQAKIDRLAKEFEIEPPSEADTDVVSE